MSPTLPLEEIEKLPYVEVVPTDPRVVELRSYYDHDQKDWFTYLEVRRGELGRIGDGEIVSGGYFSARPAEPSRDVPSRVSSVVAKHLSFPGTSTITARMEADLHQMAAVLGKYHFITSSERLTDLEKRALLEAELEYAIGLCRAYFDLLQKLIRRLGSTVHTSPEAPKRSFKDLPDRFASTALTGDRIRTSEELSERWGLFPALAEFYARQGEWFRLLRAARNGIFHHGKTVPTILLLEEGAAIAVEEDPWKEFPVWEGSPLVRDRLGSMRGFLAHIFSRTTGAGDDFLRAFLSHVAVPRAIGPNMNVFVRDAFSSHLLKLEEYLEAPWEGRGAGKAEPR